MDWNAEYDNRARVASSAGLIAGWACDAAAFRAAWPRTLPDLAYGPGEREKLDLFLPDAGEDAPLAILIHGGYWQALDRSWVSHCARGLVLAGVAVAVPSYDLCPTVTLARIVEQMRAAVEFLHRRRSARILAIGHSAGGHLAAMLMATDWRARDASLRADLVPAALPISGLFELAPLRQTRIGAALNLTEADAHALSPRWMAPPTGALHCVVGGDESQEFLRQSRDFATAWGGGYEAMPGQNHFTVLDALADPGSALVARAAAMARSLPAPLA